MGKKGQIFLTEEFQLIDVEEIAAGTIHLWMLKFVGETLKKNKIFA